MRAGGVGSNDGLSKRHTELLKDGRNIGRLGEKTTKKMLVEFKAEKLVRRTRIRNAKSLAKRVKSWVKSRQIGGIGEDVVNIDQEIY